MSPSYPNSAFGATFPLAVRLISPRAAGAPGRVGLATAEGLGLGVVNGPLAEEAMERCRALGEVAQLPVLVVDDAEQIPAALLDEILGLGGDPKRTVQQLRIILFGDLSV